MSVLELDAGIEIPGPVEETSLFPSGLVAVTGMRIVTAALLGTTACTPIQPAVEMPSIYTTSWFSTPFISNEEFIVPSIIASEADSQAIESNASILHRMHERTKLTWDQLARLFGVSRRSVHLWAAGGRMTARNEESLLRINDLLKKMESSSEFDIRRAALSLLEETRLTRASRDDDINRPASTWNSQTEGIERN